MRKIIFLLIGLVFIINNSVVLAHDKAQPHFFRVNGAYITYYPITTTSLGDFVLPQEIDETPVLVNQPVEFEIEKRNIPLNDKTAQDGDFIIDFGDGNSAHGIRFNHTYTNTGSYILKLSVKPVFAEKEINFDSILLNVVVDQSYQLPKSLILVNGQIPDSSRKISFSQPINLEASSSGGLSKMTNFFWDLGDGVSTDSAKFTYKFSNSNYGTNILLRIKDAQGFIADSSIRLENKDLPDSIIPTKSENSPTSQKIMIVSGLVLILILGFLVKKYLQKTAS